MPSPADIKRTARQAGLLYLALSILAMIGYFYLRPRFVISGDPAATARNILANETLYRAGILIDVTGQILFILVVVALYRLFSDVDRTQTRIMVALVATGIAAQFASFVFNTAPLIFLSGSDSLSAFSRPQLETLAYTSLSMAGREGQLLTSIWGLWLFPFAVLTIRSGFLPRFLGVLLILSGAAYVVSFVVGLISPALVGTVYKIALPLYFGEFIVVLWLAFIGAKPRAEEVHPPLQVT
jgi:hypothetical protein